MSNRLCPLALFLASCLAAAAGRAAVPEYADPLRPFPADLADYPRAPFVTADFDGDGLGDLVTVEGAQDQLAVRLGVGGGRFSNVIHSIPLSSPRRIEVSDLDGDTVPDLVVVDLGKDVHVLLGQGDGSFAAPVVYDTGITSTSAMYEVAVTQVDGGATLDLVVFGGTEVVVLPGNGDGTFQVNPEIPTTAAIDRGLVAHLDGDAHIDLVYDLSSDDGVGVLFGNGDGTFQSEVVIENTGFRINRIALADMDGDTVSDIVVAQNTLVSTTDRSLAVLLNNGDGTFQPTSPLSIGSSPQDLATGDIDGNGASDLLVLYLDRALDFHPGNGDGTLQVAVTSRAAPIIGERIGLADLDGDTEVDVTTIDVEHGFVFPTLGNGDGTFTPVADLFAGLRPRGVAIGHIDGDPHADLVVASRDEDAVGLLRGTGDGFFAAVEFIPVGLHPEQIAVARLDPDPYDDVIVLTDPGIDRISVLLGRGDGSFDPPAVYVAGDQPEVLVLADMNGDLVTDLVTANFLGNDVSVLLGNANGTFQTAMHFPVGFFCRSLAIADLDADGALDAIAVENDEIAVLLGNGDGSLGAPTPYVVGGFLGGRQVATGDLDGDEHIDVVIGSSSSSTGLYVLLGNGDGTLQPPSYTSSNQIHGVLPADVDNDGLLDLIDVRATLSRIGLWRGNGDGTFQPVEYIVDDANAGRPDFGVRPEWIALGDLDGDGRDDLVASNEVSNDITVVMNLLPPPPLEVPASSWLGTAFLLALLALAARSPGRTASSAGRSTRSRTLHS